jgi:hypothetical protein
MASCQSRCPVWSVRVWPHPDGEIEQSKIERWGFRNQDMNAADVTWEFLRGPSAR